MSGRRDPLAMVFEDEIEKLVRRWTAAVNDPRRKPPSVPALADELAKIARAQPGVPALRHLPPPTEECPQACPVGLAWMVRAEKAEGRG